MKKIFTLIFIFFLSCQQTEKLPIQKKDVLDYSEAYHLIEVWLNAQLEYDKLPGLSVSLVHDGEIQWIKTFGKSNEKTSIKPESLFSICSISKLFTAVAIMQLVENGKISLEDPLSKHLPKFNLKQQFPKSNSITIENILTHSSGLPRESNYPYWSQPLFYFPSKNEVIKGLKKQETLYPADTYYQYSNLGLTLLGYVIENVSKKTYTEYIQQNILEPLMMEDTKTFMDRSEYGKNLVYGYGSKKRNGERDLIRYFNARGVASAAGFTSNTKDLAKFALWQLKLLNGSSDKKILNKETLIKMHSVHLNDTLNNVKRGYGFGIYKNEGSYIVGHSGGCPGYNSFLAINSKKEIAVSVMINANGTDPLKYVKGVMNILDKTKLKKGVKSFKYNEIQGYYNTQPWSGESYITSWGDGIAILSLPNYSAEISQYKKVRKDEFRRILKNDSLGENLSIIRNEKGKVIGYNEHQNNFKFIDNKISN